MNQNTDWTVATLGWVWLVGWVLAAAFTREPRLVWLGTLGLVAVVGECICNR